jgi:hypothetical protein
MRAQRVFDIPPHTPAAFCKSCGAAGHWIYTPAGRRLFVEPEGVAHPPRCPEAKQYRKSEGVNR